mgnify:CR=1 FL=1
MNREKQKELGKIVNQIIGTIGPWKVEMLVVSAGGKIDYEKPENGCREANVLYLNSKVILPGKKPIRITDFYKSDLFRGYFHTLMMSQPTGEMLKMEDYAKGRKIALQVLKEYWQNC